MGRLLRLGFDPMPIRGRQIGWHVALAGETSDRQNEKARPTESQQVGLFVFSMTSP